jgi:hypothetical protein
LRNGGDLVTFADLESEDWERLMDEYASSLVAEYEKRLEAVTWACNQREEWHKKAESLVAAKEEEIAELKRRLSAHENV